MGTVYSVGPTSVLLPTGDTWLIHVVVYDLDGERADSAPTVTVTTPSGSTSTPTVETVDTGEYRTTYEVTATGRYFARADAGDYGVVDLTAWVGTVTGSAFPTVDDAVDYLGDNWAEDADTATVQSALNAEAAAQRARCKVPALYPADLREALLRRVMRNLAMRGLALAIERGDAESGPAVVPGNDPEVRRLEAPYRRRTVG